jgi:hypothetical protein
MNWNEYDEEVHDFKKVTSTYKLIINHYHIITMCFGLLIHQRVSYFLEVKDKNSL